MRRIIIRVLARERWWWAWRPRHHRETTEVLALLRTIERQGESLMEGQAELDQALAEMKQAQVDAGERIDQRLQDMEKKLVDAITAGQHVDLSTEIAAVRAETEALKRMGAPAPAATDTGTPSA